MIFQDIPLEPIKAVGIIVIGLIAAWVIGLIIRKSAKGFIYPYIRKNSPESYKNTINGVNLTTQIIQWAIIFVFVFQAIAFFNVSLAEQVLSKLVIFVPKMITGLLILAIGFILANNLSKKIGGMIFKNNLIIAKLLKYIIIFATILSVLEILEIKVTPFLVLFEVLLYFVAISAAIAIGIGLGLAIKPDIAKAVKELKKKDQA
jgi:hypothetical protein